MMDHLAGSWQPLRAELDGESAPSEALEAMKFIVGDRTYQVTFGGEISDQGRLQLILDAQNFTLVLTGEKGVNAGRTLRAIAQRRGDRLRVCYGLNGELPTEFSTAPRSQRYLVTYARVPAADASESDLTLAPPAKRLR